jgi:hypothetical protein
MRRAFGMVAILSCVGACQRDPGRDVKSMSDPLQSLAAPAHAAEIIPPDKVSKSQAGAVSQRIANTELTITYSRPVARGRNLFGGIVPYGDVWNPGADQATAMAVTRDILMNGQTLPAGKYSIWVIPRPQDWTLIFSNAANVYHTPYPGEGQDALRLEIAPQPAPHMEVLTFEFPLVEGKEAQLQLRWGTIAVPVTIKVP